MDEKDDNIESVKIEQNILSKEEILEGFEIIRNYPYHEEDDY